ARFIDWLFCVYGFMLGDLDVLASDCVGIDRFFERDDWEVLYRFTFIYHCQLFIHEWLHIWADHLIDNLSSNWKISSLLCRRITVLYVSCSGKCHFYGIALSIFQLFIEKICKKSISNST